MKFKSLAMKLSLQHGSLPDYYYSTIYAYPKANVQQLITFSRASWIKWVSSNDLLCYELINVPAIAFDLTEKNITSTCQWLETNMWIL